jgi:hypothetical protein
LFHTLLRLGMKILVACFTRFWGGGRIVAFDFSTAGVGVDEEGWLFSTASGGLFLPRTSSAGASGTILIEGTSLSPAVAQDTEVRRSAAAFIS